MRVLKSSTRGRAVRPRGLLIVVFLLFLAIPAIAYAGTQITYAQGVNGLGGYFHTVGYDNREYNRVWHQPGYKWEVFYASTAGGIYCVIQNTLNPTTCPADSPYKKSYCHNISDNSDITWTCQTTQGYLGPSYSNKNPGPSDDNATKATPMVPSNEGARGVLQAFDRFRAPSDRMPQSLEVEVLSLGQPPLAVPPAARPGLPNVNQSRALLVGLGSKLETLYAIPTELGGVCIALTTHGAIGCLNSFKSGAGFAWDVRDPDRLGTDDPVIVDGLVPGGVASVAIQVNGKLERAAVGNDGFFYELESSRDWPEAIKVRYMDGMTRVVEFAKPRKQSE